MRHLLIALALLAAAPLRAADVARAVADLMRDGPELTGVPFADVVHAATGHRVIPLTPTNTADARLIAHIGRAMDAVLRRLNAPDSPAHAKRRINEVSALFENALQTELNSIDGFTCDFAPTAAGPRQRSGYPDLRLRDRATGRTLYLDPKLYEHGHHDSTLRTFYYEPKRDTNKILEDAHHLIAAFAHDGQTNGHWQFLHWQLVDLAHFRVRLKAEFQASNRDLYRPEATLLRSTNTPAPTGENLKR